MTCPSRWRDVPEASERMMKRMYILLAALSAAMVAGAVAPTFENVPDAANAALKGSRGRPVRKGMVFVNGHYLPPPYVVARYGTAIYVNNVQVTDQIVSWKMFLATQPGGMAAAPAPAPAAPAKKVTAIDDLFDDGGTPPAAATAAAPADGSGDAPFVANERSKQLLKRISDYRTAVNRRLLNGGTCFFGKKYARIDVPPRLARGLLDVLPEAMRDATDGTDLYNRMRARGFVFLNAGLCAELIENRADYTAMLELRRKLKEDEDVQKLISSGSQGIVP